MKITEINLETLPAQAKGTINVYLKELRFYHTSGKTWVESCDAQKILGICRPELKRLIDGGAEIDWRFKGKKHKQYHVDSLYNHLAGIVMNNLGHYK